MKIKPRQLEPRAILSGEIIAALMQVAPKAFGEDIYQMVQGRKFDLEGSLRFRAVSIRCKEAREAKKMSIKDVSIGFARGTLSRIEAGLGDPKASTLYRIAEVLEIHPRRILELANNASQ